MRHLLLCLLLTAGCETQAAESSTGFVRLEDLDRGTANTVQRAIASLPIEDREQPRLDFVPRTLAEAEREIEEHLGRQIEPPREACETADWLLFTPVRPGDPGEAGAGGDAEPSRRFSRGWALERASNRLYAYSLAF